MNEQSFLTKIKQNISILKLLIMGSCILFVSSCEKDDYNSNNPTNGRSTAVFNPNIKYGTMTDRDGNVYKTVTIGRQTWMAENLRTTKFNDGTEIPYVTDDYEWEVLKTGAYCNYRNTTNIDTIATYGRLYNWYTINTGKLAPPGWHVPTDSEWATLITFLGGEDIAGSKLKETGATHWQLPNLGTTNQTGFTATPGGGRNKYGLFFFIGKQNYLWSTTQHTSPYGWAREIGFTNGYIFRQYFDKEVGFSIRCVKD